MLAKMKNLVVEEKGQGLSEYGLILGGVVVVAVLAVGLFSDSLTGLFTRITGKINGLGN